MNEISKKKYEYSDIKNTFHDEEPWVNMFLFSYLTVPLVYLMVNFTKITPNQISLLSLFFGLFSAYSYLNGWLLYGALSYLLSYIFDATDGKVARIKNTGKIYGAWFDIFIDRLNLMLISTAICIFSFESASDVSYLIMNCIFLGLAFIGFESRYNIQLYQVKNNLKTECIKSKESSDWYSSFRRKHGLIKEPISLPEVFIFYFVVSPMMGLVKEALVIGIVFLLLRIIKQQLFWIKID